MDHLLRQPGAARKGRTKNFVTRNDLIQRAFEHNRVDPAADEKRKTDVVSRRAARELVEEPQALLREGERSALAHRARRDALGWSEFDSLFFQQESYEFTLFDCVLHSHLNLSFVGGLRQTLLPTCSRFSAAPARSSRSARAPLRSREPPGPSAQLSYLQT